MVTFFVMVLAAGAVLLWVLPVSKDRTKRLATQVGGGALFTVGVAGIVMNLMGPAAA
ncbi:hypothetical protein [Croceicoccus gelatinilyticus]|uniref:hypothetical protein n=1 Tax=Croceicoccus gelatinilyticus TaxID=2835536 RepID=UPI001BD093F5|nr:hypothetical protein [Croceicoccus gelatinilyticus]MBS7670171.1 hypothetical protein [Croceicoccus gelatinilyticus]